ncbi:unnamed protein product [Rhizoctonia solani]|uniref:Uncharacterized protein n=1 Tax=Rhizoctonia solani TaxID=456999 RepID=A0A8H3HXW3_9AGAM|nr:unnamed protein product [Rhizoctonia solani]
MLFNRLFSFIALASLAAPVLAAPLPLPKEYEVELGPLELEIECEKHKSEIEFEVGPTKIEIEIEGKMAEIVCRTPGHEKRNDSDRSVAASVLLAQTKLDDLKPQIEGAMVGPLGSIEKKVGTLMWDVHSGVDALNQEMMSFINAEPSVVYGDPSGGAPLSDKDLAKLFSTYLLHISEIEDTVKHVSGYKFTSAQQKIRQDLLSMKKTLGTISPDVLSGAANMMAMALTMGHGVIA